MSENVEKAGFEKSANLHSCTNYSSGSLTRGIIDNFNKELVSFATVIPPLSYQLRAI